MRLRAAMWAALTLVLACGRHAEQERPPEQTPRVEAGVLPVRVNGYAIDVKGKAPAVPLELEAVDALVPGVAGLTIDPDAAVVETSRPAAKASGKGAGRAAAAEKRKKWLVQLVGPVHEADKAALAAAGAVLGDYVPEFAFVVSMDDEARARIAELPFVRGVTRFKPAYKISRALKDATGAVRSDLAKALRLRVRVDAADGLPAFLSEVLSRKGKVVQVARDVAQVEVPPGLIARLAQLEEVLWIEEALPDRLLNDTSRWVIQSYVPGSTPMSNRGLDGAGQIVGVGDTGLDADMCFFRDPSGEPVGAAHRKVAGYVAIGDGWDGNFGHGTHVSGTVAGDQEPINGVTTAGGMAPKARLFMTDLTPGEEGYLIPPDDLGLVYGPPYQAGARLHTNSWGSSANWYAVHSWSTDRFMWEHKDFLVLFANGNAGASELRVGSPATAKNIISVGATENGAQAENVASFSSNGPAADGRLKPTLTAPGVAIVSADSDGLQGTNNCGTVAFSGTSMATPTTAGAAALVRQYYVNGYWPSGLANPAASILPSAALVKATLVNSAQPMTGNYARGPVPNIAQGWGRINLSNTLRFDGDARFLDVADVQPGIGTGEIWTRQIFATGGPPLKVTLVWTDYPGGQFADVELVNDLDLELVAPDGTTTYVGNVFSGGASVTGGAADRLNVEEQVYLPVSVRGTYTVRVKGYNVPYGPQPFALVVTGAGAISSQGFVGLDRQRYGAATTVEIKVGDSDLNVDVAAADEAFVTIRSDADPLGEVVRLVETGPDTSIFTGTIPTGHAPGAANDGILAVTDGGTLTATYADANDGTGAPATATATAAGDLVPPVISAASVAALGQGSARIAWTTSEPTVAAVLYGKTPALGATAPTQWLATSHDVFVGALEEGTTYFYVAQATDEAGNVAVEGGGAPQTFTTLVLPPEVLAYSSVGDTTDLAETVLFGTALDPSDVTSLTVNGALVPTRPSDGFFQTTVPLAFGANPLTIVATDGRGQTSTTTLTVNRVPLPDLTVTSVTAPDVAGIGMGFPVTAQVCNIGSGDVTVDGFVVVWLLSEDDVLGPGDVALGKAKKVWAQPAAGGCINLAYTISASSSAYIGRGYHIGALAIVDQNEVDYDNNHKLVANLTTFEPPDLTVTAVSAPARVGSQVPFQVTTTVANPGVGKGFTFIVGVYLSTDDTITTADRLIALQTVAGLDGGASVTAATSVTLPNDLAAGTYRLGVIVDFDGKVREASETNNALAGAQITVDGADLEATSVSGPGSVLTGGSFTVQDTVTARPTGGGAGPFKVGIYLSPDPVITTADAKLGERAIPSLAAGASSSGTTVVTLPLTQAGGAYYVGALADAGNAIVELDETNNAAAAGLTVIGPDLVAATVSAPASAVAGETVAVQDTVLASAAGGATPAFDVAVYLSADPIITTADQLLGWRSSAGLAPGASSSASTPVTIPVTVAPGTYYLGVIADDFTHCYEAPDYTVHCFGGDVAKESDATNNARASGPIIVGGTDLALTELSAPANVGAGLPLVIHDTVAASGGGTADFRIGYYLSADATITTADTFLGYRAVPGLAPGGASTADTSVTVPAGLVPGTYYLGAIADYEGRVAEASETNNARTAGTIAVAGSDLTVSALSGPPSAGTEVPFTVTTTVANVGAGASPGATALVSVYLSTDPVITPSDLRIGYAYVGALGPGATSTSTVSALVPSSLAEGGYYLGAFVDQYDHVKEANETNNGSVGTALTVLRPDLEPTAFTGPASALTGGSITVSYTLSARPTGGGVSNAVLGFYLSSDVVITPEDVPLDSRSIGALASGSSSTGAMTLTIPAGLAGGTYHLGAFADLWRTVPETDEANNGLAGGAIVITGPDLVATGVSGPATAARGSTIAVTTSVAASASGGGAPGFYVGVYLSSDATIASSDLLLGYRWVPGLAPGASSSETTSVTIPATLAPGTYTLGVLADDFAVCEWDWSLDQLACTVDQAKELDATNNALAGGTIVVTAP